MDYDSTNDTIAHIRRVQELLTEMMGKIEKRLIVHDASKLEEPEKTCFDEFTPKLKASTYGSDEYKKFLEGMGVALKHHYQNNSHHPEYHQNGLNGMSLLDLIEMLCDWKAATERHANGSISKSIELNKARFSIDAQLADILNNSVKEMGWD